MDLNLLLCIMFSCQTLCENQSRHDVHALVISCQKAKVAAWRTVEEPNLNGKLIAGEILPLFSLSYHVFACSHMWLPDFSFVRSLKAPTPRRLLPRHFLLLNVLSAAVCKQPRWCQCQGLFVPTHIYSRSRLFPAISYTPALSHIYDYKGQLTRGCFCLVHFARVTVR